MKPRTKLQKEVAALSAKLPPLTESQQRWVKRNAIPAVAYWSKKNTWCSACGGTFHGTSHTHCPCCGAKFKETKHSPHTVKAKGTYYTTILTTCKGFQVARHYLAKRVTRKSRGAEWSIDEVVQIWLNEQGEETIVARNVVQSCIYNDLWNFNMPMSIKDRKHCYNWYRTDRYDISSYSNRVCRVLPVIRRNGFNGRFHGIGAVDLFKLLLTNWKAEILAKTRQYALLRHMELGKSIEHFHAVLVCNRHGYIVRVASMWCDYVDLLHHFHKDTHSPHYVCPGNLQAAHDRMMLRKQREDERINAEKRKKEAVKHEADYAKRCGMFIGIEFSNGRISCHVLQSVAEFVAEGEVMHHCVFVNSYYKKEDTIILSARNKDGLRLETVEYNLKSKKVVQSRGRFNKTTQYHNEIVALCNKELRKMKRNGKNNGNYVARCCN